MWAWGEFRATLYISLHRKRSNYTQNIQPSVHSKLHRPDLPDHRLGVFMVPVAVHLFPYISTRGGRRGDGGAVVSITEAFPLQDILCVLPLQLARQHRGIGHAVEEKEGHSAAISQGSLTLQISILKNLTSNRV